MLRRALIAGVTAWALLASSQGRATPEVKLTPDVILAGGYDDNLLFNNQGGDRIGRAGLRLKLNAEDHLWRFSFDGSASLYAFQLHDRYIPLGEGKGWFSTKFSRSDDLRFRFQAEGSDDPMTLAQLGLLGAGGTALGYKTLLEEHHRFEDARWRLISSLYVDGERRLDPQFAADSGDVAGLSIKPRYFLTRELALELNAEARTFFSTGIDGNAVGAMPGVYYRLARRTFAEVQVGGAAFFDGKGTVGAVPIWVARGLLTWEGRSNSFELVAQHDLAIPTTRGGVLGSELVEGAYRHDLKEWAFVLRSGVYRTEDSPTSGHWTPAYGVQAGAFYKVFNSVWVGVTGLHFDQLPTYYMGNVTRDAVFLRFDFTSGRPM